MSATDLIKALNELIEVAKRLGKGEVDEADAYRAQVKRVFNLPEEKIEHMTDVWVEKGKPYASKVKEWAKRYEQWRKRHDQLDGSVKWRVYYAGLKAVLGKRLTADERDLLIRYGLDRELREIGVRI